MGIPLFKFEQVAYSMAQGSGILSQHGCGIELGGLIYFILVRLAVARCTSVFWKAGEKRSPKENLATSSGICL